MQMLITDVVTRSSAILVVNWRTNRDLIRQTILRTPIKNLGVRKIPYSLSNSYSFQMYINGLY